MSYLEEYIWVLLIIGSVGIVIEHSFLLALLGVARQISYTNTAVRGGKAEGVRAPFTRTLKLEGGVKCRVLWDETHQLRTTRCRAK